jgi:tripartite-type tricarboxylate transporter receptor subunit TctC
MGIMKLPRRSFLRLAIGATALPALPRFAGAQPYPTRPVRIVVPFAAAGPNDIVGRVLAEWLSERLGQPFVIDNRPGAASNVGTEAVVKAAPDGYTSLIVSAPAAINATLYEKLSFNFIHDITPVASIMRAPNVMVVSASFPARTVAEFIAYAKEHDGSINFASSGIGASNHLSCELFKAMTSINMTHVPYRSSGPALTDLLSGQVHVMIDAVASTIELIKAGKLRPLAVTTATRSELLPDTPVMGDVVAGYEVSNWFGLGMPAATPVEIVDRVNKEVNAGLADARLKARFHDLGGTVIPGTSAEFGKLIADETEKWGKVIRLAGIKPD